MSDCKWHHPAADVSDCAALNDFSLEALRDNIEIRFKKTPQETYTWVGFVLLSLNPYSKRPVTYDDNFKKKFLNDDPKSRLLPHIFAVGGNIYKNVGRKLGNQTVVMSGESGAGKTEACRSLLSFLAFASLSSRTLECELAESQAQTIEANLVAANTILEAFGSAKTANNDNSSRFGKLTSIVFDEKGIMESAMLKTYLLAKSRLTNVTTGEQNFTIFYSLMHDRTLSEATCDSVGASIKDFKYLPSLADGFIPEHLTLEAIDSSLTQLSFSKDEKKTTYSLLLGIAELGNLEFEWLDVEQKTVIRNQNLLHSICKLLGINAIEDFTKSLTSNAVLEQRRFLSLPKVSQHRDSVARHLYESLFMTLVRRANVVLGYTTASPRNRQHVNLLDIYGFEVEPVNSFEQLCINYANERLQDLFIQQLVIKEQTLYKSEGLRSWHMESLQDDRSVIELIDGSGFSQPASSTKQPGIFQLSSDTAIMISQTQNRDQIFHDKVLNLQRQVFPQTIGTQKLSQDTFSIKHKFASVCYTSKNFVAQDSEPMTTEMIQFLKKNLSSLNDLSKACYDSSESNARTRWQTSVGLSFVRSVNSLSSQLESSATTFVRCIKPNDRHMEYYFDKRKVESQLEYAGIPQVLKVMKLGFPCRLDLTQMISRVDGLMSNQRLHRFSNHALAQILLQSANISPNECEVGTTKVFFRANIKSIVEKLQQSPPTAEKIEKCWHLSLKRRLKGVFLCCFWCIKSYMKIRRLHAATRIQSSWRCLLAEREYFRQIHSIEDLQSAIRRSLKTRNAATIITQHAQNFVKKLKAKQLEGDGGETVDLQEGTLLQEQSTPLNCNVTKQNSEGKNDPLKSNATLNSFEDIQYGEKHALLDKCSSTLLSSTNDLNEIPLSAQSTCLSSSKTSAETFPPHELRMDTSTSTQSKLKIQTRPKEDSGGLNRGRSITREFSNSATLGDSSGQRWSSSRRRSASRTPSSFVPRYTPTTAAPYAKDPESNFRGDRPPMHPNNRPPKPPTRIQRGRNLAAEQHVGINQGSHDRKYVERDCAFPRKESRNACRESSSQPRLPYHQDRGYQRLRSDLSPHYKRHHDIQKGNWHHGSQGRMHSVQPEVRRSRIVILDAPPDYSTKHTKDVPAQSNNRSQGRGNSMTQIAMNDSRSTRKFNQWEPQASFNARSSRSINFNNKGQGRSASLMPDFRRNADVYYKNGYQKGWRDPPKAIWIPKMKDEGTCSNNSTTNNQSNKDNNRLSAYPNNIRKVTSEKRARSRFSVSNSPLAVTSLKDLKDNVRMYQPKKTSTGFFDREKSRAINNIPQ